MKGGDRHVSEQSLRHDISFMNEWLLMLISDVQATIHNCCTIRGCNLGTVNSTLTKSAGPSVSGLGQRLTTPQGGGGEQSLLRNGTQSLRPSGSG